MSIFGAMNAGVSGLSAQAQAMGMLADNIANVNTIGYKGVSARFSSLITVEPTRTFHTPGGVRSNRFQEISKQGLLQSSASKTDLGIAGTGMFVVRENATGTSGNEFLYTRDGSFITDSTGNLMTSTGSLFLQGLRFDTNGNVPTLAFANLETVNIQGLSVTAEPTTMMEIAANLPADDAVGAVHQITLPLYDSQGTLQSMDYFFVKTANNVWSMSGRFSDTNTNFADSDTTTANLDNTRLTSETNFTFNNSTGNFFGSVLTGTGDITVTKTDSSTVNISVAIGADTFETTVAIPNALTSTTNFNYASATTTTPNATVSGDQRRLPRQLGGGHAWLAAFDRNHHRRHGLHCDGAAARRQRRHRADHAGLRQRQRHPDLKRHRRPLRPGRPGSPAPAPKRSSRPTSRRL